MLESYHSLSVKSLITPGLAIGASVLSCKRSETNVEVAIKGKE